MASIWLVGVASMWSNYFSYRIQCGQFTNFTLKKILMQKRSEREPPSGSAEEMGEGAHPCHPGSLFPPQAKRMLGGTPFSYFFACFCEQDLFCSMQMSTNIEYLHTKLKGEHVVLY